MAADLPSRGRAALPSLITRRGGVAIGLVGAIGLLMTSFTIGIGRDPRIIDSPLIGRQAPSLAGATLDGPRFDLASLRGKVAIVNFWASWCLQCRREHPDFVLAAERYRGSPVAFIGVVFQDTPEAATTYMRRMGGDWPNVIDPSSRTAIDWGVYGVPETFLVDGSGVIRDKLIGPVDFARLTSWIDPLVGSPSGPP
jgi:cytochrome c biogenesis protein CcmG/thiol:disulfide interchange protein DsbE